MAQKQSDASAETDPLAGMEPRVVRLAERFSKGEIDLPEYERLLDAALDADAGPAPERHGGLRSRASYDVPALHARQASMYAQVQGYSWPKPSSHLQEFETQRRASELHLRMFRILNYGIREDGVAVLIDGLRLYAELAQMGATADDLIRLFMDVPRHRSALEPQPAQPLPAELLVGHGVS